MKEESSNLALKKGERSSVFEAMGLHSTNHVETKTDLLNSSYELEAPCRARVNTEIQLHNWVEQNDESPYPKMNK